MRIAVIGAGLAGAAAARVLRAAGASVTLYDKGRGSGGRLSTRRAKTPLGEMRFDHGAQYVTAQSDSFAAFLSTAGEAGVAEPWAARLVSIDRAGNLDALRGEPRWIGSPGMSALVKFALDDFNVRHGRRAIRLTGEPGAWTIRFEDDTAEGPFERIALTLPPEQLIDLLARSDGDFARVIADARQAEIAPCWTVMAATEPGFDPGFDGAKLLGGAVRWMALTGARPGGKAGGVVLQASPDWSEAFLENDADEVARILCEEVFIRFGMPKPIWSCAHRWRYAMVTRPASSAADISDSGTVGCGGDWRLGGKAECAWRSGEALGAALLG